MLPARGLLFLALAAGAAGAEPVSLQLSTSFDLESGLQQRGELRRGDLRIAVAGRPDVPILAGISSPWLRAGPLSPAGILREACNPLGFLAGSDVFVERTGFVLDESFPGPPPGILLMPVSRAVGVFWRPLAGGGEWIGCMASALHRPGMSLEGFLSMSDPRAETGGEEWTSAEAPFAGGRIFTTAARVLMETGPLGLAAGFGVSRGELVPPGAFFNLHAAVRTGVFGLYLLMGSADGTYTAPTGRHPAEAGIASAALLLSNPRGTVDIRFSQSTDRPGFSPHPFLPRRSEASFDIERTIPGPGEMLFRAGVRGGVIVHDDEEGARFRSTRCSTVAEVRVSPLRVQAGAGWNSTDGASVSMMAEARLDRRGSRASFEGSLERLDRAEPAFSALFSLQLERPGFRLAVGAGLEDRGLLLSVGWRVRETTESGSAQP